MVPSVTKQFASVFLAFCLMGDLYKRGRKIARYPLEDSDGFAQNSSMAWGPQPYKGHFFFSDMNSGLWVVKLKSDEQQPGL